MEHSLINDLFVIIGISIVVVFLFSRLKIPSIIGFMLTGMIAGPYGMRLVQDSNQVELISEIGVILILFSIGIEFSLSKLLSIKRNIFLGGGIQVGISILFAMLLPIFFDFSFSQSIFIGFLLALSSTALIMKLLMNSGGTDSPHGRIALSIAIFQDIAILPMILLTPLLIGGDINLSFEIFLLFLKIAGIGLFLYISIKFVMPNLIFQIAKTRIKELFILSILAICILTVWLASQTGISLALGAFLAGLIISETEYSHEALGMIEPFREVFASFFFVSVGMLLNLNFLFKYFWIVLAIVSAVTIIKIIAAGLATFILTRSVRVSIITGLLLAQIGEFAFVLAIVGFGGGLLDVYTYQLFLAVTVITITLTPFLLMIGEKASARIAHIDNSKSDKQTNSIENESASMTDHLIIIGFGLNGRNLAKAAKFADIPYIIIEMNPVTVREEKKKGEEIIFGDATRENVLETAGIENAKVIVSTIPDPAAERALALAIKRMNQNVHLIIRTRYDSEMEALYSLGADEVIPEEFETSIEMFTRVLNKYNVPLDDIAKFTNSIRGNRYELFRKIKKNDKHVAFMSKLSSHRTYAVRVRKDAFLDGKTLLEANLRGEHSLTVLAIQRKEEVISNPNPDFIFLFDDIVLVFGDKEAISNSSKAIN